MLRRLQFAAVGATGVGLGWALARADRMSQELVLPSSSRTCCDTPAPTPEQAALASRLQEIVGAGNVRAHATQRGARIGQGTALALVSPGSLREAALALCACADAGVAIVPQGANTGLTGGSVARDDIDRPTVVVSMRRLAGSNVLDGGVRVLCLSGTGIADLGRSLRAHQRESHSVLGSIFLNPSVGAGVAFGSGGTQLRKGPVYTERALYLRVDGKGAVELVNELGLDGLADGAWPLDERALAILDRVSRLAAGGDAAGGDAAGGDAAVSELKTAPGCARAASAREYTAHVARFDDTVARCNADTSGPAPVRSEGKVLVLATIHDTYRQPKRRRVLWVATDSLERACELKRLLLAPPDADAHAANGGTRKPADWLMPASLEYMDRSTLKVVDGAGRALICALKALGMDGGGLARAWALKSALEALPLPLAAVLPDLLLSALNPLMPDPLPADVRQLAGAYGHHLLVELHDLGEKEDTHAVRRLEAFVRQAAEAAELAADASDAPAAAAGGGDARRPPIAVYECPTGSEGLMLNRFRFAVAPAFRTWCVGHGVQGLSLDYALPKRSAQVPPMPAGVEPLVRLRYSHFGCNVVHEDVAFQKGVDVHAAKMEIKREVEKMGGRLPAEHGHGTEYVAPKETQARWMAMDPTNVFNPGVGGLSTCSHYQCAHAGSDGDGGGH